MKKADLILYSKAVFTALETTPQEGAVAIVDGHILFVGDINEAKNYAGECSEIIDCGDGLIMPAFNDAHLHFYFSALYQSELVVSCEDCKSEEDCVRKLLPLAEKMPQEDWLIGTMWYHPQWETPNPPTKHSIDRMFPSRPVCMINGELHNVWLNSEGLKRLGITDESEPIDGGVYYRFPDGSLTGMIGEAAATDIMRRVLRFSEEQENELYRNFIALLNSRGITSVSDMALTATPGGDFVRNDIYERLQNSGELSLRVAMYPTLTDNLERPRKLREKFYGEHLNCRGVKQFFDGVSSCHTAYLEKPYTNARFDGDRGRTTIPSDEMRRLVLSAASEGFDIRVHTIGDQAIHEMLDYYAEARATYGENCGRLILEHLENFQADDIPRLAEIGVIPSVQPLHIMYDISSCENDLGQERAKLMWPFRSLIDAGAQPAFGTDCPVVDCEPLRGLYEAITRKSADNGIPEGGWNSGECISLSEAIRAYTYGSAVATGMEHEQGGLEAGKLADICVLDRDIFAGAPENILKAKVMFTVMDGKIVYKA